MGAWSVVAAPNTGGGMSPNTVVPEGMREFYETVEFVSGAGDGKTTCCIEQAVAYMAGEEVTDNPTCACPVIRRGAMRVNDSWAWSSNAERTAALKPLVLAQLGTRSTPEVERARGIMAVRFAVRTAAPFWLRKAELVDEANALAALVVTPETLVAVRARCQQARSRAYAAAAAAAYAAADAADAAAYAAADAAAYAAYAAYAAAADAADAAAYAAADAAAYAADAAAYAATAYAAADAAAAYAAADAPAARTLLTQFVGVLLAMCDVTPESAADVLANDRTEVPHA